MPTFLGHVAASAAITSACASPGERSRRLWIAAAICSVVPDADVVAFAVGIPYSHVLGHRGLSHSLVGALAIAGVATLAAFGPRAARVRDFLVLSLATASHGVLDAMTNGGLGVAFLAPFSNHRFFLPWRPILVSPIGVAEFASRRGLAVLWNELAWVWVPSLIVIGVSWFGRRAARGRGPGAPGRSASRP